MRAASLLLLLAVLSIQSAFGQFQKKFSLEAGLVGMVPKHDDLRADQYPYLFSNFKYGHGIHAFLAYNYDRNISFGLAAEALVFLKWVDPRYDNKGNESFFTMLNFIPTARYRVLRSKLSPFVSAGAGMTVYSSQFASNTFTIKRYSPVDFTSDTEVPRVSIDEVDIRFPGFRVEPTSAFCLNASAGIDYKLSQTLGFSLHGSITDVRSSKDFTIDQNMIYYSILLTTNIHIGKSKTL